MRSVGPAIARGAPPPQVVGSPFEHSAAAAVSHAPYLKRLIERRPDLLVDVDAEWAERALRAAIETVGAIAAAPPGMDEGMRVLRREKDAVHLATALADFSRAWPLERITGALTEFADASLRAAVAMGARERSERGQITLAEDGSVPGFAVIAMGKMGAGELNYSSDVDFSVFFDPQIFPAQEPRVAAVRLVAPIARVMQEVTPDGYLFRTDLRLRPDPGSTPVAVSVAAAEHYYQTLGQNWERAAFIKARAVAGDLACGRAFLASLEPYIWRKHLDFAAVEDVHSIKRQILSAHKSADLGVAVFDVKLGRGGIRDIELYAQTQQLILGGRNRKLREQGTIAALDALTDAGVVAASSRDALTEAYVFFREVEHRIQMLEDAQTHQLPADAETRARVAALAGFETLAEFDAALIEHRGIVAEIDHQLFGRHNSLADPLGSLIFTGVEDHPETLSTIGRLGFGNPAYVSQTIRGWHHGRIRAMRSERARELLTLLTPRLLRAFSGAGEPDQAFARFASFFAGLNAGVQVLSLLDARPALLDLLARLFTLAPRLADELARRPALLDALIEPRFAAPLSQDAPGVRRVELLDWLRSESTFEGKLNTARRFHREEAFRIGVQLLEGSISAAEAGVAHAELAEACVAAMAQAAAQEVQRTLGPEPGRFVVLGLGKFGGRELAEGSDLDLMLVYDAPEDAGAAAGDYYTKLTQRLISALSAPTEEGALYEVDTKLRPSGSKGPVAVRLSSFERYYGDEAWTWELLALTRLRAIAGDEALGQRVEGIARATLARARDPVRTLSEVANMRALMDRERPSKSYWDLKLAPGGFIDIEFIAQALQLTAGALARDVLSPNTGEGLSKLAAAGLLAPDIAARLASAWRLWSDLHQMLRVCVSGEFDPEGAPPPLLARIGALTRLDSFDRLQSQVRLVQQAVRADFLQIVGAPGDGNVAPPRS